MRAGTDTALAWVVKVFGSAHPHTAYLFANKRANRSGSLEGKSRKKCVTAEIGFRYPKTQKEERTYILSNVSP